MRHWHYKISQTACSRFILAIKRHRSLSFQSRLRLFSLFRKNLCFYLQLFLCFFWAVVSHIWWPWQSIRVRWVFFLIFSIIDVYWIEVFKLLKKLKYLFELLHLLLHLCLDILFQLSVTEYRLRSQWIWTWQIYFDMKLQRHNRKKRRMRRQRIWTLFQEGFHVFEKLMLPWYLWMKLKVIRNLHHVIAQPIKVYLLWRWCPSKMIMTLSGISRF